MTEPKKRKLEADESWSEEPQIVVRPSQMPGPSRISEASGKDMDDSFDEEPTIFTTQREPTSLTDGCDLPCVAATRPSPRRHFNSPLSRRPHQQSRAPQTVLGGDVSHGEMIMLKTQLENIKREKDRVEMTYRKKLAEKDELIQEKDNKIAKLTSELETENKFARAQQFATSFNAPTAHSDTMMVDGSPGSKSTGPDGHRPSKIAKHDKRDGSPRDKWIKRSAFDLTPSSGHFIQPAIAAQPLPPQPSAGISKRDQPAPFIPQSTQRQLERLVPPEAVPPSYGTQLLSSQASFTKHKSFDAALISLHKVRIPAEAPSQAVPQGRYSPRRDYSVQAQRRLCETKWTQAGTERNFFFKIERSSHDHFADDLLSLLSRIGPTDEGVKLWKQIDSPPDECVGALLDKPAGSEDRRREGEKAEAETKRKKFKYKTEA